MSLSKPGPGHEPRWVRAQRPHGRPQPVDPAQPEPDPRLDGIDLCAIDLCAIDLCAIDLCAPRAMARRAGTVRSAPAIAVRGEL